MSFRKRSPLSIDARAMRLVLLIAGVLLLGGCAGTVTLHSKAVPTSAAPARAFAWPDKGSTVAMAQVSPDESGFYVALSCPVADKLLEITEVSWAGNGGGGIYVFAKLAKPLIPTGKPQAMAFARTTYSQLRKPPGPPKWVGVVINNGDYVLMWPEEGVGFTTKDGYACESR